VAFAGWLALAVALVAELVTPRWQGCGELPWPPGEKVTAVGGIAGFVVLAIGATIRLAGDFTRREALVFFLVFSTSVAALVGVVTLWLHHPVTPGCG